MVEDVSCVRCRMPEDTLHVLRDCQWVKTIWEGNYSWWKKPEATSFREWLAWIIESTLNNCHEEFSMIVWMIWKARNEYIFEDTHMSPDFCCIKAKDLLVEYQKACAHASRSSQREQSRWNPPPFGELKLNFDAAVNTELGKVGLGIIARDSGGNVVLTKSKTLVHDWAPGLCEARAALEAITTAKEEGWSKVIVEGDAQVIIRALQQVSKRKGQVQLFIDDAIALYSCFDSISFMFCFRECNYAAHRLAKWAVNQFCDEVWHDGGPIWISDVIVSDNSN